MSYPHFNLEIHLTVQGPREADDCVLLLSRLLPFVPRNGDTLELWREHDEEDSTQIELENVVYSFKDSAFVARLEDNSAIREGTTEQREVINYYLSFGFKRISHPIAYAIK